MAVVNLNWYNLQSLRRYPLADSCTGETDDGRNLPNNILVDCNIKFPASNGAAVAFVEAITISSSVVTVIIGVEEEATNTTPLRRYSVAAVTVIKPAIAGVHYSVTPLVEGVGGWVVFGDGIDTNFTGRFSTPAQTKLQERCANRYVSLPIDGIKLDGSANVLDGVVRIDADLPIKLTARKIAVQDSACPEKERTEYNAIFIGLDEQLLTDEYNPFSYFLHPCAGRPESDTCPKPGIQTINGIGPDCYGNIDIVFDSLNSLPFQGGLAITTDYGIADACQENKALPQFYSDTCCPRRFDSVEERDSVAATEFTVGEIVRIGVPPITDENPYQYFRVTDIVILPAENQNDPITYSITWEEVFASEPELSALLKQCDWPDPTTLVPDVIIDLRMPEYPEIELPLCLDFCFCSGKAPLLREISGSFTTKKIAAPFGCVPCHGDPLTQGTASDSQILTEHNTLFSDNGATVSLALLKAGQSDWAVGRTVATKLKIAPTGINRDGGLVLNYRTANNGQTRYYAAVIDVARGALRLLSYTNNIPSVIAQTTFSATTDTWYKLSATATIQNNAVLFNIAAEQNDNAAVRATINDLLVPLTDYEPLTGTFGLYTNRSNTYFNDLQVI